MSFLVERTRNLADPAGCQPSPVGEVVLVEDASLEGEVDESSSGRFVGDFRGVVQASSSDLLDHVDVIGWNQQAQCVFERSGRLLAGVIVDGVGCGGHGRRRRWLSRIPTSSLPRSGIEVETAVTVTVSDNSSIN